MVDFFATFSLNPFTGVTQNVAMSGTVVGVITVNKTFVCRGWGE